MYGEEKILLLDLLKVLHKHSDEDNRLTQNKIIELLKKEYGISAGRRTVKNNIEKLIRYGEREDANEILYKRSVRQPTSREKEEVEVFSQFGMIHDFTVGELRLLIDSILFSKHISKRQRTELIGKLKDLTSKHFNSRLTHVHALSSGGPINEQLFRTIEALDEAISESKQVSFHYNNYVLDEQSTLVLQPRTNKKGEVREYLINPYQMVAANGRYYLICNNDAFDNISHYRLDRMTEVKKLSKDRKRKKEVKGLENGLNLPKHMAEHIYMFTGESAFVSLRFNKLFFGEFVDWFGTEHITFSNETTDEITANVQVNRIAMRKWALQYALHVRVLSPPELVEEIKEDIQQAMGNYGGSESHYYSPHHVQGQEKGDV